MSLYSALYAGVSGLGAQSSAMATVADNITNINTVGYKGAEADFRSLVTDGSMSGNYSAGGVAAAPRAMISKQGLLQASGGLTGTAAATTRLQARANLQSTQAPFTGAYAAGDMATGALEPHFSRTFEIYDAQGGGHHITMGFVKTAPNQWVAEIYGDPAEVTAANGLLASGNVAFNPDGSLDLANSSPALFGTLNVAWTNQAGSSPIELNLGSQDGLDGLTQFGSASALIASSSDGGMLNNLVSVEVNKDGLVSAIFDDGTSRGVFQLPMATFANPDGLTSLPGNAYGVSQKSGNVVVGRPGELGSGSISAGTLEASTVDLAQEFTNMIRFQRAYSASSKIITTVDDMLQEVSGLKR